MQERVWQITEHQLGHFTVGWETEESIFYVWYIDGLVSQRLNRIAKVPQPGVSHTVQSNLTPDVRRVLQETFEALPESLFEAARRARRAFEDADDMVREHRVRAGNLALLRRLAEQHGFELRKAS